LVFVVEKKKMNLSKKQIQSDERNQKIEKETSKILDTFENILKSLKVSDNETKTIFEGYTTNFYSSQLINSSEELITLIQDLKQDYINQDVMRINANTKELENSHKLNKEKMNEIIKSVNFEIENSLFELEEYYQTKNNFYV
jgi:hypothetical protein